MSENARVLWRLGKLTRIFERYATSLTVTFLENRRLLIFGALLCCVAIAGIGLRLPQSDPTVETDTGDDWWSYHRMGVDIFRHGLSMPVVHGVYSAPGGFLYSYFVAAVYWISGVDPRHVYILQGACVALALLIFYVALRPYLSALAALLYLAVTAYILYVDLYKEIAIRLLSENLVVLMIGVATWVVLRAWEHDSAALFSLAGLMLGVVMLTRLSLELIPLAVAVAILVWSRGELPRALLHATILLVSSLAVFSLLPLRNAVVAGHFTAGSSDQSYLLPNLQDPAAWILIAKKTLFCAGILPGGVRMNGSGYSIAAHFLLPTVAAVAFVVIAVLRRRLEFVDGLAIAWIAMGYGPFIALPRLGGYGMRFQWPTEPLLLFLAVRLVDSVLRWMRERTADEPISAPEHAT
jgi:hypothetical protein